MYAWPSGSIPFDAGSGNLAIDLDVVCELQNRPGDRVATGRFIATLKVETLPKLFNTSELLARVGSLILLKRTRDKLRELATKNENLSELTRELIASTRTLRSEVYLPAALPKGRNRNRHPKRGSATCNSCSVA